MLIVTLFVGFVVGVVAVIGVEVLGVLFLIRKLGRKVNENDVRLAKSGPSGREELSFSFPNKQGWVWVLEKEKILKTSFTDKGSRQQKRKIEIREVSPVRKYANIKDQLLILTEPDGTVTTILLLGCTVEAVSATNLSSRKWAKRYPVKVESKSSVIYHGSKLFYMYFETSCEKESWCKALRLGSCDDKEKLKWFVKSRSEFHNYLASLNIEYPSFLKPSIGFNPEIGDKSIKIDGSSSKVRHFLKKLAKKASKSGVENRTNWRSLSDREDRKTSVRSSAVQESGSVGGSSKLSQTQKTPNYDAEEKSVPSAPSGSRNQIPISSDTDSADKITSDDGTLCFNLLISRLFFDAKSNADLRSSIQARIQRTLSTIRTPSYIGEIICTGVDPGNVPPYIHGMRVLPSDLKELVAMEIDIEYYGGAVLDIETRLEVQELNLQENMGMNSDSTSVAEVTTDLLEGFEYYGEQLKLNEQTVQATKQKGDETPKLEESKSFKGNEQASSNVSKWKSILNSVAKQVSQVPLSLAIRVTTLRGTLRVYIKPPPSDQLWFGFTSMPDIDFSLESSVGDHKITNGHIALFIISKFKAAIRETMVLPNSESITIPFMLAEKDDWVPQKVAPFIWINPEPTSEPTTEPTTRPSQVPHPQPSEEKTHPQEPEKASTSSTHTTENKQDKTTDSSDKFFTENENPLEDLKIPLLENEEQSPQEPIEENKEVQFPEWQHPSPPQAMVSVSSEESNGTVEGDERRMGTKAKMLGLRKKMGEKLEEKRRNIEEKGRHIVEKMRGPGGS